MQPRWGYPAPVVNFHAPHVPSTLYHAPLAPALPVVPALSTLYEAPAPPKPAPVESVVPVTPLKLPTLYEAPAPPTPTSDHRCVSSV